MPGAAALPPETGPCTQQAAGIPAGVGRIAGEQLGLGVSRQLGQAQQVGCADSGARPISVTTRHYCHEPRVILRKPDEPSGILMSDWMGRLQCDPPDRAASSMGR